jgi:hypothetical protein
LLFGLVSDEAQCRYGITQIGSGQGFHVGQAIAVCEFPHQVASHYLLHEGEVLFGE